MKESKLLFLFLIFYLTTTSQTLNLLPAFPEPATNPHIATAFNGVKIGTTTVSKSFAESDEITVAVMSYLHPSSPNKNYKPILDRLVLLLDSSLGIWATGRGLNDMMFTFSSTSAYLMLKQYQASAIPVGKQALWESGIRKNIAAILAANPDVYSKKIVGALWLNGDVRLAMGVYFGALAVNDTASAAIAKDVIENLMPKTLLADGGTHYVGYANESPSYHGEATIRAFAWYYILTRSQVIKDFICATKNYIPLVHIPVGVGYKEWSTSPAWKPYYNQTTLAPEALAKAYLSGDGYNYQIGKGSQNLYLAFLYRSGLVAKTLPDNYMLYDRNSMGPRGRYGNWGVVASLRDQSSPAPELTEASYLKMCGTNTLVGAFTLNATASATTYPINAAFQGAAPSVKLTAGAETDWQRGSKWAFLTGANRKDAQTKSHTVYGLSTRYGVCKQPFIEQGWNSLQQWVITPDRVIGMTEMESTTATTLYGLAQRIQLVSGRLSASGTRKVLNMIDANTFEYGDLRVKIIGKDYMGKVDTIYHGVMNTVGDKFSVMILLNDVNSGSDVANLYPTATRRYAFFEVTNKDRTYSTNPTRLTLATGLEGFEFQESAGRKVRMIHNTTAASIALNTSTMPSPFSKSRMLKSWDEAFVSSLVVSGGSTSIPYTSIPAYGHVLIMNSNITDDHSAGYNTYDSIFNPIATKTGVYYPFDSVVKGGDSNTSLEVKDGFVKVPADLCNGKLDISILNMEGAVVKHQVLDGDASNLLIDLSKQAKGVYVMKVSSVDGNFLNYKLLKR